METFVFNPLGVKFNGLTNSGCKVNFISGTIHKNDCGSCLVDGEKSAGFPVAQLIDLLMWKENEPHSLHTRFV